MKYKDIRPKKGLKSPLKMFSCPGQIQEFFLGRGHPNLPYFQACFFSCRIILKHIENKKGSRGSGMMLPKIF